MPFKSKAQQRYLRKNEPDVAEEFARGMSGDSMKNLPERVSDLGAKPKSLRYASDVNVKKNVEDASMEIDKFVRSDVLKRLIEDLKELDYDSKLKPKMVSVSVESGEAIPEEEMEEMSEDAAPMEGVVEEEEEMEDEEGMDPRLMKMIRSKRRGK